MQRPRNAAICEHPLINGEYIIGIDQRRWELDLRVVHVVAPLITNFEDVGKPLGKHHGGMRAPALDERIGDHGCGMHDRPCDVRGRCAGLVQHRVHASKEPVEQIIGGRQCLVGKQLGPASQDNVGECATDVDGKRCDDARRSRILAHLFLVP